VDYRRNDIFLAGNIQHIGNVDQTETL